MIDYCMIGDDNFIRLF